jgi:hypothetical protein
MATNTWGRRTLILIIITLLVPPKGGGVSFTFAWFNTHTHNWNAQFLILSSPSRVGHRSQLLIHSYVAILENPLSPRYKLKGWQVNNLKVFGFKKLSLNRVAKFAYGHQYLRKTPEDPQKDLSKVTDKLYHIIVYTSHWSRFELTTSVVIDTDCIGSCKSNYHTIIATRHDITKILLKVALNSTKQINKTKKTNN